MSGKGELGVTTASPPVAEANFATNLHTPGPWTFVPRSPGWYATVRTPNNGTLCIVHTRGNDNGRLIAAAPDLLEALRALVAVYDDEFGIVAPEMDAAYAALAKAEGRS